MNNAYVQPKEVKIKEKQDKFLRAQLEKEREQQILEEIERTEKERIKKKGKSNTTSVGLKTLKQSGILDAYQYLLTSLCKYGLPTGDLYEFSALTVLRFEKKVKQQKKQELAERMKQRGVSKEVGKKQLAIEAAPIQEIPEIEPDRQTIQTDKPKQLNKKVLSEAKPSNVKLETEERKKPEPKVKGQTLEVKVQQKAKAQNQERKQSPKESNRNPSKDKKQPLKEKVVWNKDQDTQALANASDPDEVEKLVVKYFNSVDLEGTGFIDKDQMLAVVRALYEIEIQKRPEFKTALKDPKIIEAIKNETDRIAADTIKKLELNNGRVSQEQALKGIIETKKVPKKQKK